MIFNPGPDLSMRTGDILILIAEPETLRKMG